jgi:hypothetical protein
MLYQALTVSKPKEDEVPWAETRLLYMHETESDLSLRQA